MQETIQTIREKIDLLDVISEYLPLKKKGRNHLALCPFHQEKTPSFSVSQEKQIWHCFGCGQGGNLFDFVMKIEKVDFLEAAEILAEKAGLPFDRNKFKNSGKRSSIDKKIYQVLSEAAIFFQKNLFSENSRKALSYLEGRKLSPEVINNFGLGLAPSEGTSFFGEFTQRGYSPASLLEAGLVIKSETSNSYYDRFRDRIIFPVYDVRGRVIAFGGRIYREEQEPPKYLNSPETAVYIKGDNLYGLNLAKEKIRQLDEVIVVEGYLDAISLHQGGFQNTIAALGTAFTYNQAKLLSRFTKNILVAFDLDEAGLAASLKSIEITTELGLRPRVLSFAGFKDPDEFIRNQGPEAVQEAKKNARSWLEFTIDTIIKKYNLSSIEEKSAAAQELVAFLARLADPIIQTEYGRLAAKKIGLDENLLVAQINQKKLEGNKKVFNKKGVSLSSSFVLRPLTKQNEAEKILLRLALDGEKFCQLLQEAVAPDYFSNPELKNIAEILWKKPAGVAILDHIAGWKDEPQLKNLLTSLMLETDYIMDPEKTFFDCLALLKKGQTETQQKELLKRISAAEATGDFEAANQLKKEYCQYLNFKVKGETSK
jgi:DNA primase